MGFGGGGLAGPAGPAGPGQLAKIKPGVTRWVLPGWFGYNGVSFAITAGRIYYIPILVTETTTFIRIGIGVDVAAAGTVELRIYNWNDGVPGSLVLNAGTVDTGTVGAKEITISQELTQGNYFLAFRGTGTPQLVGLDVTFAMVVPVAGYAVSLFGDIRRVIMFADAAFADPAPAPTGALDPDYAMVLLREN